MSATPQTGRAGISMSRMLILLLVLAIRTAASLLPMAGADDQASGNLVAFLARQAICHAGGATDDGQSHHPAQHDHDCDLCPICQLMAAPLLSPASTAWLPPRAIAVTIRLADLPPATGPPLRLRSAASPRGPPAVSV
jgi:hypothetical protein